jgi:hypothetical protein
MPTAHPTPTTPRTVASTLWRTPAIRTRRGGPQCWFPTWTTRSGPYLVFPGGFYRESGTGLLGDLGVAVNLTTGRSSAFVVADFGPGSARLGEVSIALAEGLGGTNVNPRNGSGMPTGEMMYVVFPYSSRTHHWPLARREIDIHANELLTAVGGIESLTTCREGP